MKLIKLLTMPILLASTIAFGADMPPELQGKYVYPDEKDACQNKNYSLTITKSGIEANEFNCKIAGKPNGNNGRYTIPMKCSSEDGSSKSNSFLELKGNKLMHDKVEYLRCGESSSTAPSKTESTASTVKPPQLCRDDALIGGAKKIFKDQELSKPIKDMDSAGYGITPEKVINIRGKVIYQGGLFSSRTGHEVPGSYYIDAKEWGSACK